MSSQVFNIGDGIVVWLKDVHGLPERWRVCTWENPFPSPAAERWYEKASDRADNRSVLRMTKQGGWLEEETNGVFPEDRGQEGT